MAENNDIFLSGSDALVHLAEPIHRKYSTKFAWDQSFSTYASYDRFFNPLPLYAPLHVLGSPLASIPPVAYVLNR